MKKQVLRKPAEAYIKDWAKAALFSVQKLCFIGTVQVRADDGTGIILN